MLAVLSQGHGDVADWLWLIAAILFAVVGVVTLFAGDKPNVLGSLVPFGLCLVSVGWLIL